MRALRSGIRWPQRCGAAIRLLAAGTKPNAVTRTTGVPRSTVRVLRHQLLHRADIELRALLANQKGASAIEMGLLVALISVVCIGVLEIVGSNVAAVFSNIAGNL